MNIMDISEGKQSLQKIQELERQIEASLDHVRQQANDIVFAAKTKAEEMIRHKEKRLASLRQSLTDIGSKGKTSLQKVESTDVQIDQTLIQNLAKDLFNLLIKEEVTEL